jgi:hypothetical protein
MTGIGQHFSHIRIIQQSGPLNSTAYEVAGQSQLQLGPRLHHGLFRSPSMLVAGSLCSAES